MDVLSEFFMRAGIYVILFVLGSLFCGYLFNYFITRKLEALNNTLTEMKKTQDVLESTAKQQVNEIHNINNNLKELTQAVKENNSEGHL